MELLLNLLFAMAVLFALARVGSAIVSKFGLPGLIGEILIGILIANLAIGDWSLMETLGLEMPVPGVEGDMGNEIYTIVYALAELGVIFLLFSVGLETKVKDLLGSGKAALLAAVMGVVLPFIAGLALILAVDGNMNHALFMAAAMVATSVGITARIIKDMKLMDSREARIIIGAAVIDDVLGMIALAVVKGMSESGFSIGNILSISIQAVLFVVVIILACKFVVPRIYDYFDNRRRKAIEAGKVPASANKLALALIVCLFMAAFAEFIGLAAIIGAFLAGMLFADYAWEWELEHKVESITSVLISFFFLNVGLQVDISTLTDTSVIILSVVVIVLALLTKYVGCGIGTRIADKSMDNHSAFNIVGVGMMPRGEVGIIIASIGLASGAMSQELYAVVVLMSVATTIIAPPILTKMFRKKYPEEYTILAEDRI